MRVGCVVAVCFGLLKEQYKSSNCQFELLKTTVELSAKCNYVQLYNRIFIFYRLQTIPV